MKLLQKLTAIIILLSMLITLNSPIISYAEGETETNTTGGSTTGERTEEVGTNYEIKETEEWDISKNGDGSVIAKWTLDDKTITISGNGEMKDWTANSEDDWHNSKYKGIITNVKIETGVDNIGDFAFTECSSLKYIEVPDSVTTIGENLFGKSTVVSDIVNSGNEITSGATDTDESENSNSVNYSNNVTYTGRYRNHTSLERINVDINNEYYISIEGVLFNKDKTRLIRYPASKRDITYTIPNSVTSIDNEAFTNCCFLEKIVVSSSISRIEADTFALCQNLKNIEIPQSVTYIDQSAFNGADSIESIVVDSNNDKYLSIDGVLFNKDKTNLIKYPAKKSNIEYTIPNEVTCIKKHAFENCSNLKSVIIPKSVKEIEKNAIFGYTLPLKYCYSDSYAHQYYEKAKMPYYIIDEENSDIKTTYEIKDEEEWDISKNRDNSVIAKWTLEDRTITISGNGEMKNWPFQISDLIFCSSRPNTKYLCMMEKLEIQEGILNIGKQAFRDCYSLKTIDISSTVQSIEDDSFIGCNSLESINVNTNNNSFISIDGVLYNKEKTKVIYYPLNKSESSYIIPEGVTTFDIRTYSNYGIFAMLVNAGRIGKLKNITIPSSVANIEGKGGFIINDLESINVDINNKDYSSIDGVLYNKDKTEIIWYPSKRVNDIYIISENTSSIGEYAFDECDRLKGIIIPENVENIDYRAFKSYRGKLICKKNSTVHRYLENNKKKYILDNRPPTIELTPDGNETIAKSIKITVNVEDKYGLKEDSLKYIWSQKEEVTADKVTENFINGEEITSPENINGKVFLYIYAKDALGNETVLKSNEFNIDITKPKVVGVENENSYNDSVTITVIDGNIGTIILEKDGTKIEGYANGKEIIEEGTYRLTATDKAGNTTMVNFIIKYNRGDVDINNNIDTGDVLALLRYIAQNTSKKVAERHPDWNFNEKNKIIGDVNRNGKIDTGDVLTLQRYQAAKSSKTIAEKHPEWLNIE